MQYISQLSRHAEKSVKALFMPYLAQKLMVHYPEQSENIESFARKLIIRNAKEATIKKHLYCIGLLFGKIERDALLLSNEELEGFLAWMTQQGYSYATQQDIKISVKLFYSLLGQRRLEWLHPKKMLTCFKQDELIRQEDIDAMLSICSSKRDRAILSLLWETGLRTGEIIGLEHKQVELAGYPAHIIVYGKTGERRVPIVASSPALANYLDSSQRLAEGRIWAREGRMGTIGAPAMLKMLKLLGRKAGIRKRITVQILRHSVATRDGYTYSDRLLCLKYGWSRTSRMPANYGHQDMAMLDAMAVKNTLKVYV